MKNKTLKRVLLGMAMASPLALISNNNVHADSVQSNVDMNWHANSLATVQQELRNQNINPDQKINNAKYIVQSGDTLSQIAAASHIDMYHIAAINHIKNLNLIYVGQVLILDQGNEVVNNVKGNGNVAAVSTGNTYTLRSVSRSQQTLNRINTQNNQYIRTTNSNNAGNQNKQLVISSPAQQKTTVSNNVENNKQPVITPSKQQGTTSNTNTGVSNSNNVEMNTPSKPVVAPSSTGTNTGASNSHVEVNIPSKPAVTPSTATSTNTGVSNSQQTVSSVVQNGNIQKPVQSNSSVDQKTPVVSSSTTQNGANSTPQGTSNKNSQQTGVTSSSQQKQPVVSTPTSSTQTPSSNVASTPQTTVSSSSQNEVNSNVDSQKQPVVSSSSTQGDVSFSSQQTPSVSSSSQKPVQSSSSQSSVSSSSQSTASSSSSQQPASSASSATQSSTTSNSQSSASSSSQSSASSSTQQKTVDGYTLNNMPLSVFNDKNNLNAINNTFSGDAIENYFDNHIGKGNMTWKEAQQAQQNGQVTSAILAWNGEMLPTNITNDNRQVLYNDLLNWNGMLPTDYLNNDSQMAQINKQYGSMQGNTLNNQQSTELSQYLIKLLNSYSSGKSTNNNLQAVADQRAEDLTSDSHDGFDKVNASGEVLAELGNINNKSMFNILVKAYSGMYGWLYNDADSNWGHRDLLKGYSNWAFSIKVLNNGDVILIGEGE